MTTREQILYLDDDTEDISSLVRLFNAKSGTLEIVADHPKQFSGQIEFLKSDLNRYVALILDLRLDQVPSTANNEAADYRAMTLAQELRTLAFEKKVPDLPIFLLSVEEKYDKSYNGDDTGHDLFDLSFSKTRFHESVDKYVRKTASFIRAYRLIDEFKEAYRGADILQSLGVAKSDYDLIDSRFVARYEYILEESPVHTIARFLHQKLLKKAGIVLSEEHVAARLGVDVKNSPDWLKLLEMITEFSGYKGPLYEGWQRWWSPLLSRWWDKTISPQEPFLSLAAEERVALLRRQTRFENLAPHPPIDPSYSSYYSTVCSSSLKPLDPVDGYIISEESREPWLQPLYVSGEVLLNRAKHEFRRRLEPNEEKRFQAANPDPAA